MYLGTGFVYYIFTVHILKPYSCLNKFCPDEFNAVYYEKYVGDIFVLFRYSHYFENFNEYLVTKHANIKFTNEK